MIDRTILRFSYGEDGLRGVKTVAGNKRIVHQYNGGQLLFQDESTQDANGVWRQGGQYRFLYDGNGAVYGLFINNGIYYYVKNAQGDIVGLLDWQGTLQYTDEYDSWGKLVSLRNASGAVVSESVNCAGNKNPLRYRGYYYDKETGLYYLQSRYYDPETGRFLNADGYITTGQGLLSYNMYAYCFNNPLSYSDVSGNSVIDSMLSGITSGIGSQVVENQKKTNDSQLQNSIKSESFPLEHQPNSSLEKKKPDGSVNQRREYGADGKAKKDTDYGHADHHPDLKSPHYHDWDWSTGKPKRGDAYNAVDNAHSYREHYENGLTLPDINKPLPNYPGEKEKGFLDPGYGAAGGAGAITWDAALGW